MLSSHPIFLIEDNPMDTEAVKRAFEELNVKNEVICFGNGEEALKYFRLSGSDTTGLIFLDINMPKMNGLEFLRIARKENLLTQSPVIVLTTSNDENDKRESFKLSVAGYMVKPIDYEEFIDLMRVVVDYWGKSEFPK